jgi:hypothetical protein
MFSPPILTAILAKNGDCWLALDGLFSSAKETFFGDILTI